ncbi:hypothetical protein [Streptomyces sp. SolWspMP-sol7th]|uniref:hypothetical protein n=1 Tax=Streptomyces sp. SolWspMP-sol7th TaxID=1839776 RepID=UPI0020C7E2E9|nr:hypothetical protein [Streptomyces sp. SolWspMP-sol7th]
MRRADRHPGDGVGRRRGRPHGADPAYKILKHLDYSGPGKASLRAGYDDRARDKGVITMYCEGVVRCPNWVSTTWPRRTSDRRPRPRTRTSARTPPWRSG